MSLITRCPACGTMFKVVADQLRISEGWVRCGHCTEIFDASADLRDESELELPPAPSPTEPAPIPPAQTDEGPTYSGFESSSVHTQVDESDIAGTPDATEYEEQAHVLQEHPLDEPFELQREDTGDVEDVGPHGFSKPSPLEPEPELHHFSFVRQARRQEFWRGTGVRAVLGLVLLASCALLAGQYMYNERERLAASSPKLRPWLARMCGVLRCRIGPPLQIDAIAIETSSFNKLRGDTYRLNVTLKNQANGDVAMPSLELTLTDAQDQPVLRRVLLPAEFAPGRAALAAGDWATSVALVVNPAASGTRISGYRLLAFYP
jgi:predicted Zn finger-like uncharacterized protein